MDALRSLTINSTLNKAVTADDTPTPGYLYIDLAKMSHNSIEECDKLESDIFLALKKNNPHSKLKVLKVIKYLSKNGRNNLQRGFQRNANDIKECLQYRGWLIYCIL